MLQKKCNSYLNCQEERKVLFKRNGYPILECNKCGHRFIKVSDPEQHLSNVYSDEYFFAGKDGYPNYLEEKDLLIERGKQYAHLIAKYTKPGKVLDVGSAAGFILKGFEKSGWDCHGIEPNETMAAFGREKLNLNIKTSSIETYATEEKFDLVSLIQVIGHVYDPDKTLQNVSKLLKQDGLVLVESWNRNSLTAKLLGKRWHEYSPPSVMHWYSDETLTLLFNHYGFNLITKGYKIKKISVPHAISILEGNPSNIFFRKIFDRLKKVTKKFTIVNPFFDVKWYVFQKKRVETFNMQSKKPIAILGAGLAGLTAANYLRQKNVPFILFEASNKIAGLAASFKDKDGFSNDFGAHFVTNRLANAIGVAPECLLVKHYGETVWLKGKSYQYPFGLMKIPRMSLGFLKTKLQSLSRDRTSTSAAEWFSNRYGSTLAHEVILPLIEAWSGVPPEKLSPAVGDSLPDSILNTIYLKMASVVTGRAVSCGYNREMPEKPSVWHVYPKDGVSTLCSKLAEGLEDSIKLQFPVEEILVEDEKAVTVRANGVLYDVSAVISTAPANILAKLVKGTNALQGVSHFRFRPMVFVNVRFEGRRLLPDTVMWFPEKEFPFFRITDVTRSMPWLAPEGKSIITFDIGCEKNEEFWTMDEEKLSALCLESIKPVIPDAKKRFLGCTVLRTPIAYPVFLNEYEKERQEFEQSTHIENLLSIGRNGEFSHRFMEDVYWRTRKKVQKLIDVEFHNGQ